MPGPQHNLHREEQTAPTGGNSPPMIVPPRAAVITVAVHPSGGGSAIVYYTLDDANAVIANPDAARWVAWEAASVSVATVKAFAGPVVAVRAAAVTGPAVVQMAVSFDR